MNIEKKENTTNTLGDMAQDIDKANVVVQANKLLALERKACITKTIEYFFIQLNQGDMKCGDIEKFVENYKKYMEE